MGLALFLCLIVLIKVGFNQKWSIRHPSSHNLQINSSPPAWIALLQTLLRLNNLMRLFISVSLSISLCLWYFTGSCWRRSWYYLRHAQHWGLWYPCRGTGLPRWRADQWDAGVEGIARGEHPEFHTGSDKQRRGHLRSWGWGHQLESKMLCTNPHTCRHEMWKTSHKKTLLKMKCPQEQSQSFCSFNGNCHKKPLKKSWLCSSSSQ